MRLILALLFLLPSVAWADTSQFILDRTPTMFLDPSTADTERGPIVHLTMNDSAASTVVLNKANAALNGTANRNTEDFDATGKISGALDFYNGSTADKVDLGSDVIAEDGAFTFCAWANIGSAGGANLGRLFTAADDSPSVYLYGADGTIGVNGATSGVSYVSGSFAHYCFTRPAASANSDIYINGAFQATVGIMGRQSTLRYIGNRAADDRYFDGLMENVRIYDYALTPSQIQKIYNAGAGHQRLATGKHQLALDADGAVMAAVDHKGIEFYQSTAASRPTLAKLNGKRVLSFDGGDDWLTNDSNIIGVDTAQTIIVLAKQTGATFGGIISSENAGDTSVNIRVRNNYLWEGLTGNLAVQLSTSRQNLPTTGRLTTFGSKGSASLVTSGVTSANSPKAAVAVTAHTSNCIGRYRCGADSNYFTGTVGPIARFSRVLPESDLLRIEQGLAKEYGVSLAGATAEVSCDAYIRSLTPTLWLDSGDLSTITKDGSNKVSAWASKVGAVTFTQATADNQPTWTGAGVNTTATQYMVTASTNANILANNAKTIFLVGRAGGLSSATMFNATRYAIDSTADAKVRIWNNDGATDFAPAASAITSNATFIAEFTHDGTNLIPIFNGTAGSSVASGNTNAMTNNPILNNASGGMVGDHVEWLFFNAVLTADQRARVRSCLGQKYGVSF